MIAIRDEFIHPDPQPNWLQAAEDGLWVIDQGDDHLYKSNYETSEVLEKFATETRHSSGVTLGGGNIWIASSLLLSFLNAIWMVRPLPSTIPLVKESWPSRTLRIS